LIALGIYFHFYAPTDLFYILTHQERKRQEAAEGKKITREGKIK